MNSSRHRGATDVRQYKVKASASFLKKRSKKLLLLRALATPGPKPAGAKVFCF
jgi:hypothetical protein